MTPPLSTALENLLKENRYKFLVSEKAFYVKPKGISPILITIISVIIGIGLISAFLFQEVIEIKLVSLGFTLLSLPFFYQKWKALEAFSVIYGTKQYLLKKFFSKPVIISIEEFDSIQVHKRTLHADASPFHKDTKEYIYDMSLLLKSGKKYFLMQLQSREDPAELIKELASILELK